MEIRKAKIDDFLEIIQLWNKELKEYSVSYKQMANILFCDENFDLNHIYVAVDENKIVGFCIGIKRKYPYLSRGLQKNKAWILNLVVKKEYQKKKIGSKLLEITENSLKSRKIILSTYSPNYFFSGIDIFNRQANMFFESQGYRISRVSYSMKKNLDGYSIPENIQNKIKNSEYTVRLFEWNDTLYLIDFVKKNFSVGWLKHVLQAIKDQTIENTLLIMFKNDEIVGYVQHGIGHDLKRFGPFGISEKYRNRGLGTILVHLMWQHMKDNKCEYAWFHSTDEAGKRFYERNGMHVVKALNNHEKECKGV